MLIRAQVALQYFTNLDEDISTNTWFFSHPGTPTLVEFAALVTRVRGFYTDIENNLSAVIDSMSVKLYDHLAAPPNAPQHDSGTLAINAGGGFNYGMPEEVAVCISFSSDVGPGDVPQRHRGRVYIGPVSNNILTLGSTTAFAQVNSAILTQFRDKMLTSIANNGPGLPVWVQYSPADGAAREVTEFYIDNSFDTQRRRGHPATSRVIGVPA